MELEIFEALTSANVPADKARAAAASIKKEINEHYAFHASQLATKGDLTGVKGDLVGAIGDAKMDIIKWCIGSMFVAVGLFAAIVKTFI
jgi:hypothetical protein